MNIARISFLTVAACSIACGEIVPQNQIGSVDPGPAPVAPTDSGAGDAGPVTPPKRTAFAGNPYGSLDPANLVLDGDFEFSGRQGQMPWLSFNGGQGTLDYETGGLCFSGVRCAKLSRGDALFGWMVSPKAGVRIEITLQMRVLVGSPKSGTENQPCPEPAVNVFLIDINDQNSIERIQVDGSIPPVNGFCTYRSVVGAIPNASPGIYVEADATGPKDVVLMDLVVAKPIVAGTLRSVVREAPITATSKARVATMVDWVRKHRKYVGEPAAQPLK